MINSQVKASDGAAGGRRLWLKAIEAAVLLAIFAYIFYVLWKNFGQMRIDKSTFRLGPLIASFPLAVLYLVGRSFIWHLIVQRILGPYPLFLNMMSWLSSIPGKYIPGKVLLLLGRVYYYRGSGASAAKISLAFLIETCCACLSAALIFICTLVSGAHYGDGSYTDAIALAVIVLLVVSNPFVLERAINFGLRLCGRAPVTLQLGWRNIVLWTALMALNWLFLGYGFYLMLNAIFALPIQYVFYVTGAFALAGVIGLISVFAPSGLGVREGVMMIALVRILPEGIAAAAAIIARIWITAAELLCAGVAILLMYSRARPEWIKVSAMGESSRAEKSDRPSE